MSKNEHVIGQKLTLHVQIQPTGMSLVTEAGRVVRVGSLKSFETPFPVLKTGLPVSSIRTHTLEHTPFVRLKSLCMTIDNPWVVGCAGKVESEILSKH